MTSPNLIPRPDEVQQHSTDTQKSNGRYAGPIGEGERANPNGIRSGVSGMAEAFEKGLKLFSGQT